MSILKAKMDANFSIAAVRCQLGITARTTKIYINSVTKHEPFWLAVTVTAIAGV
jgi:hypothetical protein